MIACILDARRCQWERLFFVYSFFIFFYVYYALFAPKGLKSLNLKDHDYYKMLALVSTSKFLKVYQSCATRCFFFSSPFTVTIFLLFFYLVLFRMLWCFFISLNLWILWLQLILFVFTGYWMTTISHWSITFEVILSLWYSNYLCNFSC